LKSIERSWPWLMAGMRQYGKSGPAGCNPAALGASDHRSAERQPGALPAPARDPTQWRRVPGL